MRKNKLWVGKRVKSYTQIASEAKEAARNKTGYPDHVQRAIDAALKPINAQSPIPKATIMYAKARVVELQYDSKWEEEFAGLLEGRKMGLGKPGDILDWGHHDIRLNLGGGAWYKPDFWVITDKSEIVLIEVKGFWREAAKVRFKVARSKFPWLKLEAWAKEGGQWEETLKEK